jgi:hypothetical protein
MGCWTPDVSKAVAIIVVVLHAMTSTVVWQIDANSEEGGNTFLQSLLLPTYQTALS